jgi:hypothetical protein
MHDNSQGITEATKIHNSGFRVNDDDADFWFWMLVGVILLLGGLAIFNAR